MNPKDVITEIEAATSQSELEALKLKYLGRSGIVTQQLRQLGAMEPSERKLAGAKLNGLRYEIEQALESSIRRIRSAVILEMSSNSSLDLTAPVIAGKIKQSFLADGHRGHAHPVGQLLEELVRLFWQMGYTVADGPEVETEWYNFEALLVPSDHPARDMQDTFYLDGGNLPRTHTSGMQVRYMENHQPPIRIIAPGKVYRNEDEDARHSWSFYQIEGLVVDKGITIADLKGTLVSMLEGMLGEGTELRLRPNYFPYTEPSVEMDASFTIGLGTKNDPTGGTGWLELGGAGMVHPQVLKNAGIDPTVYSGFAFGFGPERIAAIKYGVTDVREFWRPKLNFLDQF
jgi:phenylalanyl-tRNA synthetase alpha chain